MPRRLRRSNEKIYKDLTEGENPVFLTMKDVFLMAACIGFKSGKGRKPLDTVTGQFEWVRFSGRTDEAIINAIALAETSDVQILLSTEEQYDRKFTIVEEYANTGIEELKRYVLDAGGNNLENLVGYIYSQKSDEESENEDPDILSELVDELF